MERPGASVDPPRRDAAETLRTAAGEAAGQARSLLEQQRGSLVGSLEGVADALDAARRRLDEERHESVAHGVGWAAEQARRLARGVEGGDVGELADRAVRFARREPAVFVGGALALGFVLARLLRVGADRRPGFGSGASGDDDWERAEASAAAYEAPGAPGLQGTPGTIGVPAPIGGGS